MKLLVADGGDALDIQAELDTLAAEADACLVESLEEAGQS